MAPRISLSFRMKIRCFFLTLNFDQIKQKFPSNFVTPQIWSRRAEKRDSVQRYITRVHVWRDDGKNNTSQKRILVHSVNCSECDRDRRESPSLDFRLTRSNLFAFVCRRSLPVLSVAFEDKSALDWWKSAQLRKNRVAAKGNSKEVKRKNSDCRSSEVSALTECRAAKDRDSSRVEWRRTTLRAKDAWQQDPWSISSWPDCEYRRTQNTKVDRRCIQSRDYRSSTKRKRSGQMRLRRLVSPPSFRRNKFVRVRTDVGKAAVGCCVCRGKFDRPERDFEWWASSWETKRTSRFDWESTRRDISIWKRFRFHQRSTDVDARCTFWDNNCRRLGRCSRVKSSRSLEDILPFCESTRRRRKEKITPVATPKRKGCFFFTWAIVVRCCFCSSSDLKLSRLRCRFVSTSCR